MSDVDVNSRSSHSALPTDLAPTSSEPPHKSPGLHPAKRRDKPQLSCNACRRRKVRCDRLQPCSNCSSRGVGSSCTYTHKILPMRPHGRGHLQDRINQLESLVLNLMQHEKTGQHSPHSQPDKGFLLDAGVHPARHSPLVNHTVNRTVYDIPNASAEESQPEVGMAIDSTPAGVPVYPLPEPFPSDNGSIKIQESQVHYSSSAHWSAVLDSIAELKDVLEDEDEQSTTSPDSSQPPTNYPGPLLFYSHCPSYISLNNIIESLPPKDDVDRLVFRYFSSMDVTSGIPHSVKFLKEYEEFWKTRQTTSVMWLGLLFGIMCLSTQVQQFYVSSANILLFEGRHPRSSEVRSQTLVDEYREKTVQCLLLGHYTKGGPYTLEALILYFMIEIFSFKAFAPGLRILSSTIIHIAINMGYHRDSKYFPILSPFEGEMRRRIWALVMQMDLGSSVHSGLPRIIPRDQVDTEEPRNLHDSDFDENTTELPPPRPETDASPALYMVTKHRLLSISATVCDIVTSPHPRPYSHILDLHKEINTAHGTIPLSLKWTGLSTSLNVQPTILIQRIWLEMIVHTLKISLHKKYLVAYYLHGKREYGYSRPACLSSAMGLLRFHHLIDEETKIDGRLYQNRWKITVGFVHDFLLATSILCFYLHVKGPGQDDEMAEADVDEIKRLLKISEGIWEQESSISKDARKAVVVIRHVLSATSKPSVPTDASSEPNSSAVDTDARFFPGLEHLMPQSYGFMGLGAESASDVLSWDRFSPTTMALDGIEGCPWTGVDNSYTMDAS